MSVQELINDYQERLTLLQKNKGSLISNEDKKINLLQRIYYATRKAVKEVMAKDKKESEKI